MAKSFFLKQAAWFKDSLQEFTVPDEFEIDMIAPVDAPALSRDMIKESIYHPFGPSLKNLTQGKTKIVFVVDDLGRPTPAHDIIPYVLEILSTSGVLSQDISFIVATGSHRQLSREDMARKVGATIVDSYRVTCHDAFKSPLKDLGYSRNGFPCIANKEVAEADLIIGIGCVIPHSCHGFGGGAKLFCPGIAGMESIVTMHGFTPKRGRGNIDNPKNDWDMRSASEAFVAKLPPIFLINVVMNSQREISAIFSGSIQNVFEAARIKASEVYRTEILEDQKTKYDVILINAYPLDSDPVQSAKSPWVKNMFPDTIQIHINSSADGVDYHGWKVFRRSNWFTLVVASIAEGLTFPIVPKFFNNISSWPIIRFLREHLVRRLVRISHADFDTYLMRRVVIEKSKSREASSVSALDRNRTPWVYSEYFTDAEFKKKYSKGTLFKDWKSVVEGIKKYYPKAKIAVVTCAPVQIPVVKGSHDSAH